MCRRFLWSGESEGKAIPKLSWDTCVLPKGKGGFGIDDIVSLANRMAAKWEAKSSIAPCEDWFELLRMNMHRFQL